MSAMYRKRILRLQELLSASGVEALAINAGSTLTYLTGLEFHLSERPVILIISDLEKPALFFPEFERGKAESARIPLDLFSYGENPAAWPEDFLPIVKQRRLEQKSIAVPPESMRFLELEILSAACGHRHFTSAADLLQSLLIYKDKQEIEAIRKAIGYAESALLDVLSRPMAGKSEKALANSLVISLLESGSNPELPFTPIVASGPNSANPHAIPGERVIQHGDIVLIDWGARCDGYISDITRTFQVGQLDEKFIRISEIVLRSNRAACERVEPGIQARIVDQDARDIITAGGFGPNFTHRTGHGIGRQAHEAPYITDASTTRLAPGMVFTIEPGIYLAGEGGIRIEDDVRVTPGGVEILTRLPRELRLVE